MLYCTRFTGAVFACKLTYGGTIRHPLAYASSNVSGGGMMAATLDEAQLSGRATRIGEELWFPGRWLGGLSLIVAPDFPDRNSSPASISLFLSVPVGSL
jgi:hypothetical protein